MRKLSLLFTGMILILSLSGCSSVKRYKSVNYSGEDNSLVSVELFTSRIFDNPVLTQDRSLWTLSANAQTRLVQILDERYPDNQQFMGALTGSYDSKEVLPLSDYTEKELRMVFSIQKNRDYSMLNKAESRFSPADRIEYLRLTLEIPEDYHLRFHEWNHYQTAYKEIDIADVSFSRSFDLSVDAAPGEMDLGSKGSLASSEKQVLSQRYLELNGRLSDHRLVLEEEGTRGVDLTGNISADVSLRFSQFPQKLVQPRFTHGEGSEDAVSLVDMKFVDVLVPAMAEAPDTLYGELTLDYTFRHVHSGWNTFAEWDDRVEYYQGSSRKRVPLFLKKDYLPPFFCIAAEQGEEKALKVRQGPEKEYLLQFENYRDASLFLQWLQDPAHRQTEPLLFGNYQLLYGSEALIHGHPGIAHLRVWPVH